MVNNFLMGEGLFTTTYYNMGKKDKSFDRGEIIIYQTSKKEVEIQVRLEDETVWLTQKQMASLFDKGVPTINDP